MAKPAIVPKPDLHHLSSRRIKIPSSRMNLEFILLEWMKEVVRHTSNVGTKDDPGRYRRRNRRAAARARLDER